VCELNKSHIISTDEDPGLQIESFAVINLCGVSTNKVFSLLKGIPPVSLGWMSCTSVVMASKFVKAHALNI
jgi:hypothetical protein